MKRDGLWITGLLLIFVFTATHAQGAPLKACAGSFNKAIEDCDDVDDSELENCVRGKYDDLYQCLIKDAAYKDKDKGAKKFEKAYKDFENRVAKAVNACRRLTDTDKDDCLKATYKASLKDLNKDLKKHFEKGKKKGKKKDKSSESTDVDKEVGDCEGALKKKALACSDKEGDKVYKCLKNRYEEFYKCVVRDVHFTDGKQGEKKFDAVFDDFQKRVADAVRGCQRYTGDKMEKCLTATHNAAIKDFKKDLRKFTAK